MAEEARDPGEQVPKAVNLVLIAVLGIYAGISVIALSALPVTQDAAGHYSTQLGTTYANDPVLGIVSALGLHGALATGGAVLRWRPRRDDPADRDQRRHDRHLAPLLVAGRAPPAPRLFAKLHPRFQTPWFTILFFSAIAIALVLPGNTAFLGNLYSFGAMLSFTIAHLSIIRAADAQPDALPALPRALERALARQRSAADRGDRRDRHWRGLRLRGRPASRGADHRHRLARARAGRLPALPPPPRHRPAGAAAGAAGRAPGRLPRRLLQVGAGADLRLPRRCRRDAPRRRDRRPRRRGRGALRVENPAHARARGRRASSRRNTRRDAPSTWPDCRRGRAG